MPYGLNLEKEIFSPEKQETLIRDAKKVIKQIFDSDEHIKEILVYGSASTRELGVYKDGKTHRGRDRSDFDVFFLLDFEPDRIYVSPQGIRLESGEAVVDINGKQIESNNHPIMCAGLTSRDKYYKNLDKPYPEGYDFTKNAEHWFKKK
jgi:hypothetical protein